MNSNIIFFLLNDMKRNHISSILQEASVVEFTTLHVLKRGHMMNPEGEVTVSDLARYTNSSLPAISRTLKQLQKGELITREIGENDRRAVSVTLTTKGDSLLTREESRLKSYSDIIYETMGVAKVEQLVTLLASFHEASNQALNPVEKEELGDNYDRNDR